MFVCVSFFQILDSKRNLKAMCNEKSSFFICSRRNSLYSYIDF